MIQFFHRAKEEQSERNGTFANDFFTAKSPYSKLNLLKELYMKIGQRADLMARKMRSIAKVISLLKTS